MGLASSRMVHVEEMLSSPSLRRTIQQSWTQDNIRNLGSNSHQIDKNNATMTLAVLTSAANELASFLKTEYENSLYIYEWDILEVMSGNLVASKCFYDTLMQQNLSNCTIKWLSTDAIRWPTHYSDIPFEQCHAVDAVATYGINSNILLMISPPPYKTPIDNELEEDMGYCDYFACCDYIAQTKVLQKKRFIVFVGELGASDGSEGMYCLLMENVHLDLRRRHMLFTGTDICGGPIEKELFIFEIKV